ncbi:MAG: cyclophilin-like family protein [Thermofilum sp.]
MYLRITFGERLEIPAFIENPQFHEPIRRALPASSQARVWKEEVYFPTEISLSGPMVTRVPEGSLAYWPPEKALCLFSWASQPYGPVLRLGWFLGPKQNIFDVEEGDGVKVDELKREGYSERLWSIADQLQRGGFLAAPRSWEGVESVVGAYVKHEVRVGFEVMVEDFGFVIESDPLYLRDFSVVDESLRRALQWAKVVRSRVDVSEDGFVVLSEFAATPAELVDAASQLVQDYVKVLDIIRLK